MTKKEQTQIHLGFSVGDGEPVEIPIRNTVVTGQTQESGKTTTLEAMVQRAGAAHGIKSLAFVTKRGEQSFTTGRSTQPYFRERTDWEFVAGILEAERREKLKFERSWIIRACRGARTLADVRKNVRKGMEESKRGMDRDVYLTLDAYLENVVPALEQVRWASSLSLQPGLNVMNLVAMRTEVQQLVIASCLQWIYQHEEGIVTILPEAWEFLPQGRRSPVKLAATELVRKGSVLKNFIWLDSQDIGGVEKEILRSCPVWLIGVQREINELKRALSNIPAGVGKPKLDELATLDRGQFFACFGKHAIKTYVQPASMWPDEAQAHARGEEPPRREEQPSPTAPANQPAAVESAEPETFQPEPEDDQMSKEDIQAIQASIEKLAAAIGGRENGSPSSAPVGNGDEEQLYQRFKSRLTKEAPAIIRALVDRPQIHVKTERPIIQADKSVTGRCALLISEGLFDEPIPSIDVAKEFNRRGWKFANVNLGKSLSDLTTAGALTREGKQFVRTKDVEIVREK